MHPFMVAETKRIVPGGKPASHIYVDYIRVIATLFVIYWHCVSDVYYKFGPINEWLPANFAFGLGVRWTVPCFFMVSGALLLGKNEDILVFYKKRFLRLLLPLITWTIVYALIRLYVFKTY